jgi:hypothetical protein
MTIGLMVVSLVVGFMLGGAFAYDSGFRAGYSWGYQCGSGSSRLKSIQQAMRDGFL